MSWARLPPGVDKELEMTEVEHVNRSIPLTARHIRIIQRAYDCTQMYTKITLDDLKRRLYQRRRSRLTGGS